MGIEILIIAAWYASTGALTHGWRHSRSAAGTAARKRRESIGQRLARARQSGKNRWVRWSLKFLYGSWVFVRVMWRASAGMARSMRAGWDTGWAEGVDKARERQAWKEAHAENARRDRAEAAGICPGCDHPYADGRVDGCDCKSEQCPCSARVEERADKPDAEEDGKAPDAEPATQPAETGPQPTIVTENGRRTLHDPSGSGAQWIEGSAWDEEIILRRRRPADTANGGPHPQVIEGAVEEVVDLDKVVEAGVLTPVRSPYLVRPYLPPPSHLDTTAAIPTLIRWRVDTSSPGALLAAPRAFADETPGAYSERLQREGWDVTTGSDPDDPGLVVVRARIRREPDGTSPGDKLTTESADDYGARLRAAGYQLEPRGEGGGFQVTGYTPPPTGSGTSTTSAGGDSMPVQGDGTTISRTRQALRGFIESAVSFVLQTDRATASTLTVRDESNVLVQAAERLAANMATAEVDAESVGEVRNIQVVAGRVGAVVDRLHAAAAQLGVYADTLSSESRASMSKLNAGHTALHNARREAPNNGATKRWYQPA